jgi:DNA-binding NtrC family response regulator
VNETEAHARERAVSVGPTLRRQHFHLLWDDELDELRAAKLLGISRKKLYAKIRKYQLR